MIQWFQSNQSGAPQINGLPDSLIAVLNGCLVTGFNLRTITSITRDGTIATATADGGHGFRENDVVRIEGANEAAFNGIKTITNVTTNSFEFAIEETAEASASGTFTAKIAPLDWESPFSDTHKAVYRAKDVTGNRLFLRVDETPQGGDVNYGWGSQAAKVQMWEVLNDVDKGTGSCQVYWRKGQNQNDKARPWLLIGDSKRFWLCVNWSESYGNRYVPYFFGDFPSFKPGDGYGSLLAGHYTLTYNHTEPHANEVTDYIYSVGVGVGNSGIWLARSYSQLGGAVNAHWVGAPGGNGGIGIGATGLSYPNQADNGVYVVPMMVQEQTGPTLRGRLPGLLCPLHQIPAPGPWIYDGFVIDGTVRKLLLINGAHGSGAAKLAFDITGPWE